MRRQKSVYTIFSWVDGEEVESILPKLKQKEQYDLGVKSGEILRTLHTLPAPTGAREWYDRYFAVIDKRLDAYKTKGVLFDGNNVILDYIENNRNLLKNRPQSRLHGDYHEGNLIISKDNTLSVIDWHFVDFENYGDPWYEFNRIGTNCPAFATGQIDGYFANKIPDDFWKLLIFYHAVGAITSIVWAKYFAPERLDAILKMNTDILKWINKDNPMPTWYLEKLDPA